MPVDWTSGLPASLWRCVAWLRKRRKCSSTRRANSTTTALDELAVALVEFAEDIHAGIGLWQALENYQSEFFGTPLPLFLDVGEPLSGRFDPRRVRHFLYILWRQLKPDLILAPDHRDLTELAETAE